MISIQLNIHTLIGLNETWGLELVKQLVWAQATKIYNTSNLL